MNWLAEPLEKFFTWSFDTLLTPFEMLPSSVFIVLIVFGLAYWTFYCQPKYNKKADADSKQIK